MIVSGLNLVSLLGSYTLLLGNSCRNWRFSALPVVNMSVWNGQRAWPGVMPGAAFFLIQ